MGTLLLGGLGGALTPVESLPAWAQTIAPGVPSYWAMRGYRSVILDGGGLSEVWLPVAVLLGFALAFAAMARVLFKVDDTKVFMA